MANARTSERAKTRASQRRDERRLDDVFKALADPTRREILSMLATRRRSVGEIASNFRTSRPAISKHIRLLREAGLVGDTREGSNRVCELDAELLQHVDTWLDSYRTFWTQSLVRLKTHVEND